MVRTAVTRLLSWPMLPHRHVDTLPGTDEQRCNRNVMKRIKMASRHFKGLPVLEFWKLSSPIRSFFKREDRGAEKPSQNASCLDSWPGHWQPQLPPQYLVPRTWSQQNELRINHLNPLAQGQSLTQSLHKALWRPTYSTFTSISPVHAI